MKASAAWLAAIFGWQRLTASAQAGLAFVLPPTTHAVGETTAQVFYWLPDNTTGIELVVLQDGQEVQRRRVVATRAFVQINGLSPATTYTYRIEVNRQIPAYMGQAWGDVRLRTQPYEWPVRFASLGDSGYGDSVTAQLAQHIAAQDIDFFVHLGDMVYNSDEYDNDLPINWAHKYFLPFKDVLTSVPHFPTLGNHDRDRPTVLDGISFYHWVFQPLNEAEGYERQRMWYSFVANNIRFLSLNTQVFYTDGGRQQQNAWLDEQLAIADQYRTTIPFFHIPFRASTDVHPDDGLPPMYEWEYRFIEHSDDIGLIMSGHAHFYERLLINGLHYLTSGGGSVVVYGDGGVKVQGSQFRQSVSHYVLVDIYEDRIELNAYDVNNTRIDGDSWLI